MVFQGSSAAISHTGKVRSNNQDSGYSGSNLFAVADGMGGHAGGDVASSLAIARLERLDRPFESTSAAERALRDAIADAAVELIDTVHVRPSSPAWARPSARSSWSTTTRSSRTSATRASTSTATTRSPRSRPTTRSSSAWSTRAASRRRRRGTTRGARCSCACSATWIADPELDTFIMPTQPGDRWLLCSDGLSGVVDDPHTAKALGLGLAPGRTADNLLKQALDGGAPDNVTIVLVDVGGQHPIFSGTPTIVGSASNPIGIEVPAARSGRGELAAPEPPGGERADATSSRRPSSSRSSSRRTAVARSAGAIGWIVGLVLVLGPHRGGAVRRVQLDADALLRRRPTRTPS